ncbi:MAG: family 20 glycosylhydrolase [bacterium]
MKKFDLKIRAVQLDLARQMETLDFIKGFIDFIAVNGYNTLALYLEGRIRTPTFPFPSDAESYSVEQMKEIVRYAGVRNIEIIPVVSAMGHAELFLKHSSLESLAENRGEFKGRFGSSFKQVFCPSLEATYTFLEAYFTEICELFPSKYFHAGCDESWDIGCCDLCRARLQNGETQADLFAKHLLAVRRIVTGKLGKRMIVWDDMFEYYPQALEALPRDVIMACWQYQPAVEKAKGHFNNRAVVDSLTHYDRLGFDYFICPADEYTIHNVESFTEYGANHHPLGGWMTIWSKRITFMLQSMPAIAYTGRLWASGVSGNYDELLQGVVKDIFGINDKPFYQAIRAVCGMELYQERCTSLNAYLTCHENDADYCRPRLVDMLLTVLPGYIDKVKGNSRDIVGEIMLSLRSEQISHELQELLPKFFKGNTGQPELIVKLDSIISRIEGVGRDRVAMWQRVRPDISPADMVSVYARYCKEMREVPAVVAKHGYLKVHFMLPDQYSAQTTRVFIQYSGVTEWEQIGVGVFKGNKAADCFYSRIFWIAKDRIPTSLKIETSGFGGQGFTYFEAENSKGRFTPCRVSRISGNVSEPENLLCHDWQWSFAGNRNTLESVLNPDIANATHSFEVDLSCKP